MGPVKKKCVISVVILVCLVMIGSICIYRVAGQGGRRSDESDLENMDDSEMMHGEAEPEKKSDINETAPDEKPNINETGKPQKEQGGHTEWEPEQEHKKEGQEETPEQEKQNTPQPNTETGWGPIT